jgi:hypothetical protein
VSQLLEFQPRPGLVRAGEARLLIVVGLTGAGKSSFTRALGWPLLPNRRELVDRYVLPAFGRDPAALDRTERFELTRRWRQEHPGGVAEALAAGYVPAGRRLVFDGLRGADEVAYAREHLPRARFVVLEAPAAVRLERLLGRGDGFDRVAAAPRGRLAPLAAGVLDEDELERFAAAWPADELAEKLSIIAAEQRNYHPEGPRRLLAGSPRALFIDTTVTSPAAAARKARLWMGEDDEA